MENDISENNTSLSQYFTIQLEDENELNQILDELDINGEITDKNHPLVNFIKNKKENLKPSRIKDSYIKDSIKWREYKRSDDLIYLFRIVKRINNNEKLLIKKEFQIHEKNEDLSNICPKFICYFFSNFLNFSVFKFKEYLTLEEILKNKTFSKKELFTALSETVMSLMMEDKYYIFPFLTPSNILYTEESGKEFFFLAEIFLETDSKDKEKEIELTISNEWLVPEFKTKKSKITFASNICCLGYLFYRIIFGEKPFKNEKERKEKKIPKLNYDSNSIKYKELIENCIKN